MTIPPVGWVHSGEDDIGDREVPPKEDLPCVVRQGYSLGRDLKWTVTGGRTGEHLEVDTDGPAETVLAVFDGLGDGSSDTLGTGEGLHIHGSDEGHITGWRGLGIRGQDTCSLFQQGLCGGDMLRSRGRVIFREEKFCGKSERRDGVLVDEGRQGPEDRLKWSAYPRCLSRSPRCYIPSVLLLSVTARLGSDERVQCHRLQRINVVTRFGCLPRGEWPLISGEARV